VPVTAEGPSYSTPSKQASSTSTTRRSDAPAQGIPTASLTTVKPARSSEPTEASHKSAPSVQATTSPAVPPTKPTEAPQPHPLPGRGVKVPEPASKGNYSRNFLAGKTSLKPAYESVTDINTVTPPHIPVFLANSEVLCYPLAGAGGRLAMHPVAQIGRMPTLPQHVECGSAVVAFELDPFQPSRVFAASEDSKIRIFEKGQCRELTGEYVAVTLACLTRRQTPAWTMSWRSRHIRQRPIFCCPCPKMAGVLASAYGR
jgi:coronin-7